MKISARDVHGQNPQDIWTGATTAHVRINLTSTLITASTTIEAVDGLQPAAKLASGLLAARWRFYRQSPHSMHDFSNRRHRERNLMKRFRSVITR
ncbi:hypothetical protein [Hyphomicrobium sp.]|uniref:hypothetical protein n=1 Tax=Hyphomicrobium sp. TaxID=82 RepID=UPI002FE3EE00